ncbi:YciI family protein [Chitinophaga cymbidii]|uniref:YCII-related domain-containing protein n=1 Tax=Chitinophaga cymbidii TaxID=1096750 RepID=A0A512RLQ6_9BACT|nr:YciI family protein [Chitinophaga cymbidii]GEP96609.1 hypothetical protein CCY01nite_28690 [Chitinophaga cymbidii]
MAKLLPVLLLAVFLTFVIATFSPKNFPNAAAPAAAADSIPATEIKQYWMVFLKKGPYRGEDTVAEAMIRKKHIRNVQRLASQGKMVLAGPFGGDGELQGIFIMDCKDSAEVAELVKNDTAVMTGRLDFEIEPWWTTKNCLFQ